MVPAEDCPPPSESIYPMSRREGWKIPDHPILGPTFRLLCILGTSRTDLNHWQDTTHEEWEEHVKVMISRFNYLNFTAGLILATTAVLLSSHSPLTALMDYNTPASYALTLAAFGASLLSVISGVILLVIYESGVTHKNMETLKDLSRGQVFCLLLWTSWPSICLAVAIFCLYLSIFIACSRTTNILVRVLTSSSLLAFLVNSILAFSNTMFVRGKSGPHPSTRDASMTDTYEMSVTGS